MERKDHPPPDRWEDFEDLCLRVWRPILDDPKKHGRAGQRQQGVDIYGRHGRTGQWWGIQCKQKSGWPKNSLSFGEIEAEVRKAESFEPPLAHFIVATTAPRDATAQKAVRKLSDRRLGQGLFSVDLVSWNDLVDRLYEGPVPVSHEEALAIWLDRVGRGHRMLMPYFERRGAPLLENVYVELQLDPETLRRTSGMGRGRLEDLAERPLGPMSIRQVLDLGPATHPWVTRRWLLRGDPGSGKTTLLRHLAATLAEEGGEPWVPVFESLPRLMRRSEGLLEGIANDLERADQPGAQVRQALEERSREGRLALLLDGLDEVPREHRGDAEALLGDLAQRWPQSPLVVTTRPIGAWSPGPEFLELEVLPFDASRRHAFLAQWFGDEDSPAGQRADQVAGALEADANLRELASNPLYLTLMALLVEEGAEPARHRARLFDQIFDLLEEGRHHKPPTPLDHREVAHEALRRLAYRMTEENRDSESVQALERRLAENPELRQALEVAWPRLRGYLDDVAEKTGILGAHDGPDADWRFWHRTFREALVAEQLERQLELDLLWGAGETAAPAPGWRGAVARLRRWWRERAALRHARGVRGDESRWAEPYALLAGRVASPDELVKTLIRVNRELGLRALATAQGLKADTLSEVLKLSGSRKARRKVYERVPELIDDPLRALALLDQLRRRARKGDLFFLEQAVVAVGNKWPDARSAAERLQGHLFDHIPAPPEDLFRWIETPHDGRVELWRKITAGRFLMGSPDDEKGRDDDGPQHEVTVESPFWLATVPVTNTQYAAFDPTHRSHHAGDNQPVDTVTWHEAMSFCRWLAASLRWARGARLPTEAEWEYACRAGTETRYWSGDQEADLARVGWYSGNSQNCTHRVGEKPANPWGLYDVHGNVWEWTLSKRTADYSGREAGIRIDLSTVDAADLAAPSGDDRVTRGGGFVDAADWARSAVRFGFYPGFEIRYLGFRVLLPSRPEILDLGS